MKVQEVVLEENIKRYMLVDGDGLPVIPVLKYLKYLDQTGKSRNSWRSRNSRFWRLVSNHVWSCTR